MTVISDRYVGVNDVHLLSSLMIHVTMCKCFIDVLFICVITAVHMPVICICVSLLNCYYKSVLPCIHGQSYMYAINTKQEKKSSCYIYKG